MQLQADSSARPFGAKIFLSENRKICISIAVSSRQEGRFARIVTIRGAGCGGRDSAGRSCAQRSAMWRTAKSCGPGTPGLVLSLAEIIREATVTNKVMDTGESTKQLLKPLRRECR
jgi:hypothetical protein